MTYISLKNGEHFTPHGIAGELPTGAPDELLERILFYSTYTTGPQGAHYELLREPKHTDEDVNNAKKFLRRNYDVVSIKMINE